MNSQSQRVWITGASSGLGAALATAYDSTGAATYLTARSVDKLTALKHASVPSGKVFACDLTNDFQLTRTIDAIYADSGHIDIAILNAGTYQHGGLGELTAEDARALFELNFFSVVRCIELLAPRMAARKTGHIVVIGSVAGDIGLPYAATYSASKSALNRLCESLYPELLRQGVRISIVQPGFIKTPLTDKNEFPMPFLIDADKAAEIIVKQVAKNRFQIRFPFMMSLLMRRLARLPMGLFLKITRLMLHDE